MKKFQRKNQRSLKKKQFLKGLQLKKNQLESSTDCSLTDSAHALPYRTYEVIEEILFLGVRYRVEKQTTYLTIAYFSIYQSADIRWYSCPDSVTIKSVTGDSSKKLALALFAISSKFNDIVNVSIDELTRSYGDTFRNSIVVLQQKILEISDFQIPQETPYTIFYHYCEQDELMMRKCFNIFEKALLNKKTYQLQWQILAKSVIHYLFPQKQSWNTQELPTKILIKSTTAIIRQID